jgi:regulator of protease activity HflC (stomatin/prohibitin superfamily)
VVSFRPQPVITEDNLVVEIDTVLYFQVTDPRAAAYEIANYIQAVEQLTVTTLRNVVGSLDLEMTLTSRDTINSQLRGVLDEATGKWGIRVNRVEIKAIDPPKSIKEAMEKQMRAEGDRSAAILKAQGQSQAIDEVFQAVHRNDPDPQLLAYQYLQMLPELAKGPGNTFWVIPSEVTSALQGVSKAFTEVLPRSTATRETSEVPEISETAARESAEAEKAAAEAVAEAAETDSGLRQLGSAATSHADPLADLQENRQRTTP